MQDYPFHPLCEQYPMMPDDEFTLLVADMKASGYDQRFPIFLFDGKILDGRTKYLAAKQAKVEPVFKNLPKDTDLEAFVERANEHRRHLTPEWITAKRKERVARVAEKKTEGKSNRVIAEEEGVSEGQVRRDLETHSTASGGDAVEPPEGKVTGKDGKKRDAKKPQEKPVCDNCRRKGIRFNCPDCKALGGGKKQQTSRSGTSPGKNGRALLTSEDFMKHLGAARRVLDQLARQYKLAPDDQPIRGDAGYKEINKLMNQIATSIAEWEKKNKEKQHV